jgi:3-hydroxybutyryl-CoA dehydrogenase
MVSGVLPRFPGPATRVGGEINALMKIRNIGVIGCGQMGSGIVQVCAQAGYAVLVSEVSTGLLNKGLAAIEASLERGVQRGKMTAQDRDNALGRIKGTVGLADFNDRDLVIEAAIEDLEVKKRIFTEMDSICPPAAILATNTSCLSVAAMAATTGRPDKVLGTHFFNPVPAMKLLEIVRTDTTGEGALATAAEFGRSLGKTVIIARDSPGFIVNRLMIPQVLDAIVMLEAGLAAKEDIDTGMTLGLNYPMGPLALADLIGLDTVLFIANGIHDKLNLPHYAAPRLLKEMVAAGQLGRKTGHGFYDYK